MRVAHYIVDDISRPLSAREIGKQGMADQPQRWRRRLAINEHALVAVVAVVCAAYAVVVTL